MIMHSYASPRWSSEFTDCSVPLTMDTYNKCSYNCLYCFSYFQKSHTLGRRATHSQAVDYVQQIPLSSIDVVRLRKLFDGHLHSRAARQFAAIIERRKTVQWGGLSDPFDEYERAHGVTLAALRMLAERDYPLTFSTKATWWTADPRYREVFRGRKNWHVKFSIINMDAPLARAVELGVPSPQVRLDAIKEFASWDAGEAVLRLRPFIVGMSDRAHDYVRLIAAAAHSGAAAMTTEFFCLERRADFRLKARYNALSRALGYDVLDYYVRNSRGSGYLRLNWRIKEPFVREMQQQADALGLRFYVSDAHFKELSHNCACCGLPDDAPVAKGHFAQALQLARKNGSVRWSDIALDAAAVWKDVNFVKAAGFNNVGTCVRSRFREHTLFDMMRRYWNTPNNARSPYRYFAGVLMPKGVDECGDVVYRYNADRASIGSME